MFSASHVNAGYTSGSNVIKDVSLELERGKVLCLLGRNGAGKTSLLKTIMGLMPFSSGANFTEWARVDSHEGSPDSR